MFRAFLFPWRLFKRQSWWKKLLILLVLAGLAWWAFSSWQHANQPPAYEIEAARLESITEVVSGTGNVTTAGAAQIFSTTTGIVDQVYVDNGQAVSEGDELFSVRSTATRREADTALSNYLTAKNTLEAAEANLLSLQASMFTEWDQFKELAESDDYEDSEGNPKENERNLPEFRVPQNEWLAAESKYKNQQQVVQQARVNQSAAWQAYQATQDSTVTANFEGQVQNLAVAPGDSVSASNSTNPALLLVDPLVVPVVSLQVSETDVLKIEAGQKVSIEFDALDDQFFDGVVDRVDSVAQPVNSVVNYNVYARLQESDAQIKSGMTADVDIVVEEKEAVLTVPSSAVKPHQGGRAVRVVDENGEIEFIPVEIGSRGDGRTEILSGIEVGTKVIVALRNEQVERDSSGGFF